MGRLTYVSRLSAEIPDETLAHLQSVIWAKLRRNEQFAFTWTTSADGRRVSVWLNPAISLSFEFDGADAVPLDPAWIDELRRSANSAGGLQLIPRPDRRS